MKRLYDKKAIIIGGTSGIGKAIVKLFAAEGANVVFCGRSQEQGMQISNELNNTKFITCDITKKNEIKVFFENAITFLNGMDIAVNNAGISGEIAAFHETDDELLFKVMETNFFGIWQCLKKEIQYFISQNKAGSIVNVSSTSGLIGNGLGLSPYSSSKHALIGLTKSVALEYAKNNIRVNAICPGFVDTPMTDKASEISPKLKKRIPAMHPMGRVATTEEIANAALYLCSDESTFTTGSSMVVDGGLTI
ncbi:MAG TPA: SDR family oxidoreductase [Gammaproteobacteria bacterium]|nr:SDR family oxidoreductase [Gammaproteobacteria bacterium]